MDYGVRGAGDRGGGTSSPSPSAPPPVAISTRSTAWGDPGEEPDTAAPLISPRTAHAPAAGAGEERRRRGRGGGRRRGIRVSASEGTGGVGAAGRSVWVSFCEGAGGAGAADRSAWVACHRRHGWSGGDMWGLGNVRDRGGGTSSPSPSAPPPVAISTRSTAWGDPGEEPDTTAHQVSPRTDPAPTGGGGGAPQARVGWGCRKSTGIPKEARAGRGRPTEGHGYPLPQAPAGWGCLRSTWVSLAAGAGGGLPANCVCVARRGETRVTGMTSGEHPGPAPLLGGEVPDLRGGSPVCIRAIARMQG